MNSERIDPDTLAAFIDGTLPARDRERVLQALAKGGAAYEDLLETQALRLASDAPTSSVPEPSSALGTPAPATMADVARPHQAAPRWRHAKMWTLASFLAAASVAAIVVVRQRNSASPSPTVATVGQLAAAASGRDPAATFGADWDQANWSITRGPANSLDERVHAFRLGVRFIDFALAVASTNTEARRATSRELSALASSSQTGNPVAERIDAIATDSANHPSSANLTVISDELRSLAAEPSLFDAGAWSQSARLALRAHQTAFFAYDAAPMRELRRIVEQLNARASSGATLPDDVVQPLRRLAEQRVTSADVTAIGPILDSTVARGGRYNR